MKLSFLKYVLVLLILVVTSCNTLKLQHIAPPNQNHLMLGTVISESTSINPISQLKSIPTIYSSLAISISRRPFSKSDYGHLYDQLEKRQTSNSDIDTSNINKFYYKAELIDYAEFLDNVNQETNMLQFVSDEHNPKIVTSISFISNEFIDERIPTAQLSQKSESKDYYIKFLSEDSDARTLDSNEIVIFDYDSRNICWGLNYKGKALIKNLIGKGKGCPKDLTKKIKKQKKTSLYDY